MMALYALQKGSTLVCRLLAMVLFITCVKRSQQTANYTASSYGYQSSPSLLPEGLGNTDAFPIPSCGGITLEEATIDELQAYMTNGRLTSVQITTCYLQRLYQVEGYIK